MSQQLRYFHLAELIMESLEGSITPQRGQELTDIISNDPKSRKYYLDFVRVYAQLSCQDNSAAISKTPVESDGEIISSDLWQELAKIEKTAEPVQIDKPDQDIIENNAPVKIIREVSKLSVASFILSAAALLFIMILVMKTPVKLPVAVLTESINARWLNQENIDNFQVLHEGEMELQTGIAKITFEYGAEVLIEAPAKIELCGFEKMKLFHGKVFANVPEHAKGFTVETPNSTIIDLGTEFGVQVNSSGKTDVHMFTGKASLIPGMKGRTGPTQDLFAGDAKQVDLSGTIHNVEINDKAFVRKIYPDKGIIWRGNDIDLADLVGGGDGFGSGTESISIHPVTGKHYWVNAHKPDSFTTLPNSKKTLTEIKNYPALDCTFIPDGRRGPINISTASYTWNQCPETSGLCYWGVGCDAPYVLGGDFGRYHPIILGGINYLTDDRKAITFCSNLGITFDLNMVRDQIPSLQITKFKSLCGKSDNSPPPDSAKVDCWVLLDGKQVFQKKGMVKFQTEQIDIDIKESNRFLTLIVTEGDDGVGADWFAFAEPRLVIQSSIK